MSKIDGKTRKKIYDRYLKVGVYSAVAKEFKCDPKTVSRIVKEFNNVEIAKIDKKNEKIVEVKKEETVATPQHIITDHTVIIVKDGKPQTIDKNNKYFDKIIENIRNANWDKVFEYLNLGESIVKFSKGKIQFIDEFLYVDGKKIHGTLADKIVQGLSIDFNVDKYINFINNASENKNNESIEGLYRFLEANCIEITDDGKFLAFKIVSIDYKSLYHSADKIDNTPGNVVTMDREKVDSNPNQTCSTGLHVCSSKYLSKYGSVRNGSNKVVLCEIDPKDVCAVPVDYKNAKMRVCEYKVVKDITEEVKKLYLS